MCQGCPKTIYEFSKWNVGVGCNVHLFGYKPVTQLRFQSRRLHSHPHSLGSGKPSLDKVWRESNRVPHSLELQEHVLPSRWREQLNTSMDAHIWLNKRTVLSIFNSSWCIKPQQILANCRSGHKSYDSSYDLSILFNNADGWSNTWRMRKYYLQRSHRNRTDSVSPLRDYFMHIYNSFESLMI